MSRVNWDEMWSLMLAICAGILVYAESYGWATYAGLMCLIFAIYHRR